MLEMNQKAYIAQSMYWWSRRTNRSIRVDCSLSPLPGLSGLVAWAEGQILAQLPVFVPDSIVIKTYEKLLHLFVLMLLSLSYPVAWPVSGNAPH